MYSLSKKKKMYFSFNDYLEKTILKNDYSKITKIML